MWSSVVSHPLLFHWLLFIGLAICALSISLLVRAKLLLRKGGTTLGRVVRLIEHGDPHESDITWSPVVEYEDSSGEVHEFECPVSSHAPKTGWQQSSRRAKPEFNIGDPVKVVYDPSNPGVARIKSWERIWAIPLFLGGGWRSNGLGGIEALVKEKTHNKAFAMLTRTPSTPPQLAHGFAIFAQTALHAGRRLTRR